MLKGKVSKAPMGGYLTEKRYDDGRRIPCQVSVYLIDVRDPDEYAAGSLKSAKNIPVDIPVVGDARCNTGVAS